MSDSVTSAGARKPEASVSEASKILAGKEKITLAEAERLYHLGKQFRSEKKVLESSLESGKNDATRTLLLKWVLRGKDLEDKDFGKADSLVADYVRARKLIDAGDFEKAATLLSKMAGNREANPPAAVQLAKTWIKLGNMKKADETISSLEKHFANEPDTRCLRAYLHELGGNWEKALEAYDAILSEHPTHAETCFRAAVLFDLRGEDERAMELYKSAAGVNDCFSGALLNLGLLYEDQDQYDAALECYRRALNANPADQRARLLFKNVEGAMEMYYDETEEKESEKSLQILRTPITDFELSVRSRNCLAKMQIKSLGDLVKKSESELLSYKNFGETSLREIKELLKQKGLRLGMGLDDDRRRKREIKKKALGSDKAEDSDVLNEPVAKLQLNVRARKCMENLGINTLGDLTARSEKELLGVENFGQTSLNEVKHKLEELGLKLQDSD